MYISLKVFDLLGKVVAILIDNDWQDSRTQNLKFTFDQSEVNSPFSPNLSAFHSPLTSAVFFCTLSFINKTQTIKLLYLK